MTNENMYTLNQDLVAIDLDESNYDPLIDDSFARGFGSVLEGEGYIGDPAALAPKSEMLPVSEKTAREKIDDLFSNMIPFKRYLLSIMEFCEEPRDFSLLDIFVADLQAKRQTIYSTADFCRMLEKAEALSKITEDGTPYDEIQVEPVEVEQNGQIFLESGDPPPALWQTTEAGLQAIEEDNPIKALLGIFEAEARYRSAFFQILELCSHDTGASITEIKERVNKNPVLEYPRKTALFFLDYLDRNGALSWDGNWRITSVGRQALEFLNTEGDG